MSSWRATKHNSAKVGLAKFEEYDRAKSSLTRHVVADTIRDMGAAIWKGGIVGLADRVVEDKARWLLLTESILGTQNIIGIVLRRL